MSLKKKCGGTRLRKDAIGFLSVCAVVMCATVLTIPIGAIMGILTDAAAAETKEPTKLRIGFMQSIDSMNPYVGLNDASYIFYGLVYDAMNVIDNKMNPTPDLAKRIEAVPLSDPAMAGMPYGSIWEYEITPNAYFTDDEPFTADDVVYNIWLNAEVTHYDSMWAYQPYSYFMKEAWKVDDYTVRIKFWNRLTGEPTPASYAYIVSIPMLPKHCLENFPFSYIGMDWPGVFNDTFSPGMPIVGTGPFMATPDIYSEWLAGNHITLVKNPNYHWAVDKGENYTVKFDQLIMRFFQDSTSMVLALKNGDIDVAAYPPTAYQSMKNDVEDGKLKNITCFDGRKVTQYWTEIAFCMNDAGPNPSRLDPIVRQALQKATNKQYIIDNFYGGLGDAATTLIPPVNEKWHYEPNATEKAKFNFSLAEARDLLEANGYIDVDSDGIRECTINSPAAQEGWVPEGKKMIYEMLVRKEYPEEKDIAQYLKDQWKQIGVTINYLVEEEVTMASTAYSYAYDTLIWYWSADIDPNYQLFTLSSYAWNGWSDCKYGSAEYDAAYTSSVMTMNETARKNFTDEAQRVFYNDSAYILLAYGYQTYAWRNDTFSGWGDWAVDPGRSVDNFWMGNPLWFDLVPLTPPPDEGLPWVYIIAGAVIAAAVVVGVAYYVMRGKKKEGSIKDKSPLGE
jgi:peptide/nickel transport system substrate-binding protein